MVHPIGDLRRKSPVARIATASRSWKHNNNVEDKHMHGSLKIIGYVIVLLVILTILYSGYTSIRYWSGIGV